MLPNTPSNIKLETCISHQMLTSKKIMCLFANQYEMHKAYFKEARASCTHVRIKGEK